MKGRAPDAVLQSSIDSAVEAGLLYVTGQEPGIRRVAFRSAFRYFDPQGRVLRDKTALQRITALVIPPNWTNVWICAKANGHLQATGRDARQRKQYLYHVRYRAQREQTKYQRMILFGKVLPKIRRSLDHDLRRQGLPKEKVLAAVVRLMDLAHIRVGNEEYAKSNQSFGLTTMRDRHVAISGAKIHFQFKGKSGQVHELDLYDKRLAATVKRCRDLPGYHLFQYVDDAGGHAEVDSGMVNDYLRSITGEEITAKDFRTWHGTVHAAERLGTCDSCGSETETKKNVLEAVKAVSQRLGNRPATCRKYYIHPAVLDFYATGELASHMKAQITKGRNRLDPCERCVLQLLTSLRQ